MTDTTFANGIARTTFIAQAAALAINRRGQQARNAESAKIAVFPRPSPLHSTFVAGSPSMNRCKLHVSKRRNFLGRRLFPHP